MFSLSIWIPEFGDHCALRGYYWINQINHIFEWRQQQGKGKQVYTAAILPVVTLAFLLLMCCPPCWKYSQPCSLETGHTQPLCHLVRWGAYNHPASLPRQNKSYGFTQLKLHYEDITKKQGWNLEFTVPFRKPNAGRCWAHCVCIHGNRRRDQNIAELIDMKVRVGSSGNAPSHFKLKFRRVVTMTWLWLKGLSCALMFSLILITDELSFHELFDTLLKEALTEFMTEWN